MTIEAAGDVITGGLMGRAIEPRHGEDRAGADGLTHESACLNCRTPLVGTFCHACGQHAHVHRTLGSLGHDLLHGVFHFEGKVWTTMPMLFLRPGGLTRRYIHGERAKFVSPLALFLFGVFLMFSVFETVGPPIWPHVNSARNGETLDMTKALVGARSELAKLERARAAAVASGRPTVALDRQLAEARSSVEGLTAASKLADGLSDEDVKTMVRVDTGWPALDEGARTALKNPKLLLYKLQSSAYKFSWALIPLSLPFVWLLFAWKREYKAYDHAVFVTYSLCFVMFLFVGMALLRAIGLDMNWALLALPVHMFVQLKGAYRLGVVGALWRTFVLNIMAIFALSLFGVALLALGALG